MKYVGSGKQLKSKSHRNKSEKMKINNELKTKINHYDIKI